MRADPDRVRLAAEALARVRADAWARGDRPQGSPGSRSSLAAPGGHPSGGLQGGRPPGLAQRVRRDDPQPLGAAVGGLLSARGWRQRAAVGSLFGRWTEVVGPEMAAHTRPESFADGELVISADSSAWATQVRLLAPELLRRMGAELGAGTVRRVRVQGPAGGNRGRRHMRLTQPR